MDNEKFERLIQLEMLNLAEKDLKINHPFKQRSLEEAKNPAFHVLRLMRDPNYFYFTCKHLFNITLLPYQQVILAELWNRPFPMLVASRGGGKSFLLGVYAMLRALLIQGRKVVITGAGFRQAKTIMNYCESIWYGSSVLRSMVSDQIKSGPHHTPDRYTMQLGDSTITALPLGDGQKIRGERAHDIIADEFASIPRDTFETVVAGFSVVELSPVEKVQEEAKIRVLKKYNLWTPEMEEEFRRHRTGNQTIISGTAYYQFNHFAEYWKRWKGIIESHGDAGKIYQAIGREPDEGFDWRDYSIIRIPVELLPSGYMDKRHVARSQATVHSGIFLNEFGAVFSADTNGFYKRSLVESCVTDNPILVGDGYVQFKGVIRGNPHAKYIYGVDPAAEQDNFSIVILECYPNHRRVVYCWTTTKFQHSQRIKVQAEIEKDFYGFCSRKLRELIKVFPCHHIAMDSQGGGVAIRESLGDPRNLLEGEQPIFEITSTHQLSDGKDRMTDNYAGLHIIELVNFASADYVREANHGLKKDFEDKICLFPASDTALLAIAWEEDEQMGRTFDTLEECYAEIDELKEELATIIHTQTTATLRDRWDTPEVKLEGSRRGRLRKDRYSALLMANSAARRLSMEPMTPTREAFGGFLGEIHHNHYQGPAYTGPDWFVKQYNSDNAKGCGMIIRRDGRKPGV